MNINAIEDTGKQIIAPNNQASPDALRQAAVQFEAVLLMQLTAALNGSGEPDEDALFGSDGGSDLAKKMFSEQMATTIANAGGIGLADSILQQFGVKNQPSMTDATGSLAKVMAAVKDIKGNISGANDVINANSDDVSNAYLNDASRTVYKSPKTSAASETFSGDPNDFAVVSTFADEIIKEDGADGLKPFMYNGQIINSTRPRIAPNHALTANNDLIADGSNAPVGSGTVDFQMPTVGVISSEFGMRFHPLDRRQKFHAGLDIAAPKGTPIKAAADGVVKFAGRRGGYGNAVIVQHSDGTETFYAHASALYVQVGQPVTAGATIAAVGSTGKSTGPHLHFEVRVNGVAVNPRKFFSNVLPATRR